MRRGPGTEDKYMTDIHTLLQSNATNVTDPAGRTVSTLEHAAAARICQRTGCSYYELYAKALDAGIWPYRYLRNRDILSIQEQLTLAQATVAVVGAGGLGGTVILILARMGIGSLIVIDFDVFDETNLNRQAVSSLTALGRSKCLEAKEMVAGINPAVRVRAHTAPMDSETSAELLDQADVVVDALDSVADRLTLEAAAKAAGVPLVHGAVAGFDGQLMTVFPQDKGLKTVYGEADIPKSDPQRPEALLGVPAVTPSLLATIESMEVIKIVLKRGRLFRNKMLHVDLEYGQFNEFDLSPK